MDLSIRQTIPLPNRRFSRPMPKQFWGSIHLQYTHDLEDYILFAKADQNQPHLIFTQGFINGKYKSGTFLRMDSHLKYIQKIPPYQYKGYPDFDTQPVQNYIPDFIQGVPVNKYRFWKLLQDVESVNDPLKPISLKAFIKLYNEPIQIIKEKCRTNIELSKLRQKINKQQELYEDFAQYIFFRIYRTNHSIDCYCFQNQKLVILPEAEAKKTRTVKLPNDFYFQDFWIGHAAIRNIIQRTSPGIHFREFLDICNKYDNYRHTALTRFYQENELYYNKNRMRNDEYLHFYQANSEAKKLITKFERVLFLKDINTQNNYAKTKKVFDFIKVTFNIITKQNHPDRNEIIQKQKQEILRLAITHILNQKQFTDTELPIQLFRCSNMIITNQNQIIMTFELKPTQNQNEKTKSKSKTARD